MVLKLKFKKQKFHEDAVKSVSNVFIGQEHGSFSYTLNRKGKLEVIAHKNKSLNLTPEILLKNIQKIQTENDLKQSSKLEGEGLNLTIEMETGTGKTYTYIDTIYDLNKKYGWHKFVIVVPSIAIREGVYKSLQIMEEHFASIYGKKLRYFIFDSQKPSQLESFATSSGINVMIINNHAFNKKDSNNMFKKTEFGRRLIDLVSGTNPIIIIDEPQSVEGTKTKLSLKEFNPLFT